MNLVFGKLILHNFVGQNDKKPNPLRGSHDKLGQAYPSCAFIIILILQYCRIGGCCSLCVVSYKIMSYPTKYNRYTYIDIPLRKGMKKTNVVGKINWDIIYAIQESAKVTSNDTWETKLRVDPLYISDKDLVEQITQKVKLLSYYEMYRNRLDTPFEYNNRVNDMAWCSFRDDSIENNRKEINKMRAEYKA